MATNTQPGNKHSVQNMINWSFDADYNVIAVGLLGYDGTTLRRIAVDSAGAIATTSTGNSTASGDIEAAEETVSCTVSPGASTIGVQLTGTWAAAGDLVTFEGTVDGVNWLGIYANLTSEGSLAVKISGSNGIYQLAVAGMVKVRVRGYTWGTPATCTVSFNSTVGSSASLLALPLPTGSNLIGKIEPVKDQQIYTVNSGGYDYFCFAPPGTALATAGWQVFQLDGSGNLLYADGNANFDNVATDPTLLDYKYA